MLCYEYGWQTVSTLSKNETYPVNTENLSEGVKPPSTSGFHFTIIIFHEYLPLGFIYLFNLSWCIIYVSNL